MNRGLRQLFRPTALVKLFAALWKICQVVLYYRGPYESEIELDQLQLPYDSLRLIFSVLESGELGENRVPFFPLSGCNA